MSTERERVVRELYREIPRMVQETVRFYSAVADQLGMHVTDLNCLGALGYAGPLSAGELASRLGLTTGAVTRVIDRLVAGGYVRRVADPADRRRVVIEPIPEGLVRVGEFFTGMGAYFEAFAARASETELRFLLEWVRDSADFSHEEANRIRREGESHAKRRSKRSAPDAESTSTSAFRDT